MKPDFIHNYKDIQNTKAEKYYEESAETFGIRSSFGAKTKFSSIAIHHETLKPKARTSWPHAEADEDEFVYVLEGTPDVWLNGKLFSLKEGDGVSFLKGTGIAHTFINNTKSDVRLLVVGEASKKDSKVFYPLNESRKHYLGHRWWEDCPIQDILKSDNKT